MNIERHEKIIDDLKAIIESMRVCQGNIDNAYSNYKKWQNKEDNVNLFNTESEMLQRITYFENEYRMLEKDFEVNRKLL